MLLVHTPINRNPVIGQEAAVQSGRAACSVACDAPTRLADKPCPVWFDVYGMNALPTAGHRDEPGLRLSETHDAPAVRAAQSPLDDDHFAQLGLLVRLARPVNRMAGYAKFSGWTTLLAGALSMPFALRNVPMLIFCVVLAGIGTRELTLRRRLLRLETPAAGKMAVNQLLLASALIAYSVYMLVSDSGGTVVASAIESDPMLRSTPELGGMMDDMVRIERLAKLLLYTGLIVVAVFIQGGTAVYYATRTGVLRRLHRRCPDWCVRVYQSVHAN